jgi:hypothetical protein
MLLKILFKLDFDNKFESGPYTISWATFIDKKKFDSCCTLAWIQTISILEDIAGQNHILVMLTLKEQNL